MSIINDMVLSSTTSCGVGSSKFDERDPASKYLIWSINRNQRRRWRDKGTIPYQILTIFWNWGIKICPKQPEKGMNLKIFLELLWGFTFSCTERKIRAAALSLYIDTVRFEIMSFGRGRMDPRRPPFKIPM